MKNKYGLVGKNLSHSFSKKYFEAKFESLNLAEYLYINFEIETINQITNVFKTENLNGLNITNPYKSDIIPYINDLSNEAAEIKAVNCIKIDNGKTIGYNTDYYGFSQSIKPFLEPKHHTALLIGTGGASKAVAFALKKIGVNVFFLSRNSVSKNTISYNQLNEHVINACKLIVNCSPVGLFPNIDDYPNIPYNYITENHLCYDLIYNPDETNFLKKCKEKGAIIVNGLSMLQLQAEKAWEIWNN